VNWKPRLVIRLTSWIKQLEIFCRLLVHDYSNNFIRAHSAQEFAWVSMSETRISTRLGQNVMLLTYVSIFYLPLAFCAVSVSCFTRYNYDLARTVVCIERVLMPVRGSTGDLGHSKYCRQRDLEFLRYHCDYCWTSNLGCRLQSRDYSRTVL
jgi:hypothetical protein